MNEADGDRSLVNVIHQVLTIISYLYEYHCNTQPAKIVISALNSGNMCEKMKTIFAQAIVVINIDNTSHNHQISQYAST